MFSNDPSELLQMFQGNMFNAQPNSQSNAPPPVPQTKFQKLVKSKIPIVMFALVTYALFALKLDSVIGGSVFGALIAWEIFEFGYTTFIAPDVEAAGIINVVFAFCGITAEKGRIILKFLGLSNKIIKDIAIFMFVFVSIHIFYSSFILDEPFSYIFDKDFDTILQKKYTE
jgi:calcium signal-modulating cyclophilin ligand